MRLIPLLCLHVSFVILGLCATAFGQTTYYVASSGNDGNNGRSDASPFQTLAKVNSLVLQPGDQILFRRGDTFRGTLQIRQSGVSGKPIVVDAYGSGNKPVLAGSVPVTGWTNIGNNTWQASCPSCGSRVTGLYRNGTTLPLGRYPNLDAANKGYLTVQSHSGKTQLTSQQGLPANFTGGEAVYRPLQWIINRATINGQNGNTLNLNSSSNSDIADTWGFFIQNHPATLDQTGEWCYNPSDKTIRLYDSQTNPNNQTITATVNNEAVNLMNVNYVTVRNMAITETLTTGLIVNSGSNLVISGNDITNSGEDGVLITGSGSTFLVENNLIQDAGNNGFTIQPLSSLTFRGNTVQRVGIWPGRGRSGDGSYNGVQLLSTANTLVENNVVDNIGFNGITYVTSTTIRQNRVSNFCLTKSDGGGIYTWNANKKSLSDIHLIANIVYNGIGAPEGTPGGAYAGANGIFFDECVQNVEVANNTVFNCRGLGFFLHASSNTTLTGNTAYNNGEGQLALTHNHGLCPPRANTIQNNVFVSRLPDQFDVKYESDQNDLSQFGTFDNNVYARPFEDLFKIRAVYNNGSGVVGFDLSLAEWQTKFGKDLNSKNSPLTYKTYVLNPTGATKLSNNYTSNTEGWSTWSPYGNGQASWDNTNKLDGGSLRVGFGSASNQSNSYVIATNDIGSVSSGRTYQLKFDAIASAAGKRVEVFLRQKNGSYRDLAPRTILLLGTTRLSYEVGFTATADEGSAILVFQVNEDGQSAWFDNVRLQEANKVDVNPDDKIRFVYNATASPTQVSIDGTYRDARNNVYSNQVSLPAYSSLVLLKDSGTPTPPPPTPTPTAGNGTGLRGEYVNNTALAAPVVLTRTDATVDFSWGDSPAPGTVNADNFSVRWTGQVQAPVSGNYTFSTINDDGARLWVNGVQMVNDWNNHGPTTNTGPSIALTAGQKYDIKLEYYEAGGGASVKLQWSYPGQGQQTIPQSQLFPATTPSITGGSTVTYLSDLSWTAATSGYGPIEKDRSNGDIAGGDGRAITLNGVTYAKGLGVHAPSEISYNLGGKYTNFLTDMGIDDEITSAGCGTVEFQVYLDGVLAYSSGTMNATTATKSINLNVSGKQTLKLVVTTAGDNYNCDHADWAGARLTGTGSGRVAAAETTEFDPDVVVRVYPVPARDEVSIRYYAEVAGEATLQLLNTAAQPVREVVERAEPGENVIKLPVGDLNRGFYVLTLTQGHQRITRKVILSE